MGTKKKPEIKKKTKISKPVKPELTDRQKFHKFFNDVYLADCYEVMDQPHHSDKHGKLGYEDNDTQDWDIMTGDNMEPKRVDVKGFCRNCSPSQESAKDAYKRFSEGT